MKKLLKASIEPKRMDGCLRRSVGVRDEGGVSDPALCLPPSDAAMERWFGSLRVKFMVCSLLLSLLPGEAGLHYWGSRLVWEDDQIYL